MNYLFGEALDRLETTLTCRHLGSTLEAGETVLPLNAPNHRILNLAKRFGFSIVPLQADENLQVLKVSHLASINRDGEVVADERPALALESVVSGDTSIGDVVALLRRHDYLFVLNGNTIDQILTPSDLNKPAMRLFLTAKLMHLEWLATELIERHFEPDSWTSFLDRERRLKAQNWFDELKSSNLELKLVNCTSIADKLYVLARSNNLNEQLITIFREDTTPVSTKQAIEKVSHLRNRLFHSQPLIYDDASAVKNRRCTTIEYFDQTIQIIDKWIENLSNVVQEDQRTQMKHGHKAKA